MNFEIMNGIIREGVNQVLLVGSVEKTPEEAGEFISFQVKTDEIVGNMKRTILHDVVASGDLAERSIKLLREQNRVMVIGSLIRFDGRTEESGHRRTFIAVEARMIAKMEEGFKDVAEASEEVIGTSKEVAEALETKPNKQETITNLMNQLDETKKMLDELMAKKSVQLNQVQNSYSSGFNDEYVSAIMESGSDDLNTSDDSGQEEDIWISDSVKPSGKVEAPLSGSPFI